MTDRPTFEQVETEYASGHLNGADYGSRVRVLMRSPDAICYVSLGVHISKRGNHSYHGVRTVAEAAKRDLLSDPKTREKFILHFGEGADEAAIRAATTRGKGTMLVNGGGDPLPLPAHVARQVRSERYEGVTATRTDLIIPQQRCIQCEKPLRPHLTTHHLAKIPKDADHPRTVEDCQRLSNFPVYEVHGFDSGKPEAWWPYVSWFYTWDGESYIDRDFCSDRCAATYGRRAAAELPHLAPGGEAPARPRHQHESVQHYESEPPRFTESGLRY